MKRTSTIGRLVFLAVFLAAFPTWAEEKTSTTSSAPASQDRHDQLSDLSLEELMNVRIDLANLKSETLLEAPATVTVISRQDIIQYGARDLSDILQWVPGFQFAFDVGASVGTGFRGLWVHEGKILVMIDGIQVNDLAYGAVSYFGTFPAEMIDHVEIIRGPGSAIYGGVAEAGVINVVTSTGAQLNGLRAQGSLGKMNYATTKSGNIAAGVKTDAFDLSAQIGYMSTPLTSRDIYDFYGKRIEGGYDTVGRWWNHAIVKGSYRDSLTLKYERTHFRWQGQDGYVGIVPKNGAGIFSENYLYEQEGVQAQYKAKITNKFQLEPLVEYLNGAPIEAAIYPFSTIEGQFDGAWNVVRRYRGELLGRYEFSDDTQILLGGGHIITNAESVTNDGQAGLQFDESHFTTSRDTYSTYGLAQLSHRIDPFKFTLGVRYENTTFGQAYAPRIGVTYADPLWNVKVLYGEGYRIPLPFQAYSRWFTFASKGVQPEHFHSGEVEIGRKLSRDLHLKSNLYYMELDNAITYLGNTNAYQNFGKFRNIGAELETRFVRPDYGSFASLSFAHPLNGTASTYVTSDRKNVLGLSSIIGSAGSYYRIKDFSFGPTLIYLWRRYGQSRSSAVAALSRQEENSNAAYDSLWMLNLGVTWKDAFNLKHVTARLTGHNLLNSEYVLIQPYTGGHAPIPAQDRQVAFHLDVELM